MTVDYEDHLDSIEDLMHEADDGLSENQEYRDLLDAVHDWLTTRVSGP